MSGFVQIGGVRIKRSNIASFGVAVKAWTMKNQTPLGAMATQALSSLTNGRWFPPTKYLYVTTYQKDNYTFTEQEIDISAALMELEKG